MLLAEPAEIVYQPRGAARQLFECRDEEVVIEGPSNTGKSRAVCEKVHYFAEAYPGSRFLLLRETRSSLTESVLVTYETHVLTPRHVAKRGPKRKVRHAYYYPNGSEVITGGLDNADRIMSTEYDMIAVFEGTEIRLEAWEQLKTRLRNKRIPLRGPDGVQLVDEDGRPRWYAQQIIDCNPADPDHWINLRADAVNPVTGRNYMTRLLSRHEDNPVADKSELARLAALTGVRRDRYFLGKWSKAEGLVYEHFDRKVHVCARVSPATRVIIGVDDGFTNPFVALALEIDGDNRLFCASEFYQSGLQEGAKVKAIEAMVAEYREQKLHCTVVVDPSAAALIGALQTAGLDVAEANNKVLDGISKVGDRFVVAGDGRPRLAISPECSNAIKQLATYTWADKKTREAPVKENDHAPDAIRYGTMYLDANPGTRFYSSAPDPAPTRRRDDWLDDDDD